MTSIYRMVICYCIAVLGFGVALVSIFGPYDHEHFGDFEKTFKRLFWILFDPGQDEMADMPDRHISTEEQTSYSPTHLLFAKNPMATITTKAPTVIEMIERQLQKRSSDDFSQMAGDSVKKTVAHNVGVYVWGAYQVKRPSTSMFQMQT